MRWDMPMIKDAGQWTRWMKWMGYVSSATRPWRWDLHFQGRDWNVLLCPEPQALTSLGLLALSIFRGAHQISQTGSKLGMFSSTVSSSCMKDMKACESFFQERKHKRSSVRVWFQRTASGAANESQDLKDLTPQEGQPIENPAKVFKVPPIRGLCWGRSRNMKVLALLRSIFLGRMSTYRFEMASPKLALLITKPTIIIKATMMKHLPSGSSRVNLW